MKKTISIVLLLFVTVGMYAQDGINYKALIKDNLGAVVASQTIDVKFTIIADTGPTNVYVETHTGATTDANGIVILTIGDGTSSDTFADIDWSSDTHSLKVEMDIEQDASFVDLGTTQFMAVPYALHANNGQSSGTNAGDMQYWNGSAWEVVDATPNEGAALQMIGGIPTWVGGTPPATVPDAPTIGTAIAGDAQASVFFTAPISDGGSAITGYTATSSPGGFTGTGTSPITVTGLSNGTAYTFSVTATNAIGTSNPSSASNLVTLTLTTGATIGDLRDGGIVFWVDPTDNTKGKVCMLAVDEEIANWYDAISRIYTNTDTGTGVYSNWYLPSQDELQLMYANLQRFGCSTNTPGAPDPSLCPTRKGSFNIASYWSSTEASSFDAWFQNFNGGGQIDYYKGSPSFVRAVRAF
ncbi:DUF1566 domain-containing protein [Patiriisocius sp. Uisw_017]|jgi:hypothetical protein|uniref:Lcl domain-containing protein n=1 Tax=Patiriisocius sp. Uisw_017 TaxID=3230968 RepID=UPI0039EC4DEE